MRHKAIVGGEVGNRFNLLDVRRMLLWLWTTPFGWPSEPEVKGSAPLLPAAVLPAPGAASAMSEDPYFVGSGDICF